MKKKSRLLFFGIVLLLLSIDNSVFPQTIQISGRVVDVFTREPVPYSYITAEDDTVFAFSDNYGNYKITVSYKTKSLTALHSGYNPETIQIKPANPLTVNFELTASAGVLKKEANIAGKRAAESFVRKIYDNREVNNPLLNEFYTYRTYEKLQFDLNDIDEDLKQNKILKPFQSLLDIADTVASNARPALPFFFTESVSDVYHRVKPMQKAEVVRASRSAGVENLVLIQLLKDIYRNVALYDDYINVFGKSFISPLSELGMRHYDYYFTDSTFVDGHKCYQVEFLARKKHELTFSGNIWFHDTTFALQRITLSLDNKALINFVDELVYVKVFKTVEGLKWVPDHEQMVVKFSTRQRGMHVSGRKSKWYSHHKINVNPGDSAFKSQSYIRFDPVTFDRDESFWRKNRTERLTPREARVFELVDSLKQMPAFQIYVATVVIALTGHVEVGKFDIGPYYHLLTNNELEGYRVRFGGRTNDKFSQRWRFEGYGAYGFKDKAFKYMGGVRYTIRKKPFVALGYQYKSDVAQPGLHESTFKDEGFIVILFRRNPSDELTKVIGNKFYFDAAFRFGLSMRMQYLNNYYSPRTVSITHFTDETFSETRSNLHVSEWWLNLRYSYKEKFIEKKNKRVSLGSDYPVFHLNAVRGLKNFMKGEFDYYKLTARITHRLNLFPYGHLNYLFEAGNVFGTVPYPLMYVQRGNESNIYDYTAFNLMNHYEFITDRYFAAGAVHHLDGFIWRHLPLLRKLDWRELISARILFGHLSEDNLNNQFSPSPMTKLGTTPYVEVGTGLENIFKLFRVDAFWRLTYRDNPDISKFGLRVSAQLLF